MSRNTEWAEFIKQWWLAALGLIVELSSFVVWVGGAIGGQNTVKAAAWLAGFGFAILIPGLVVAGRVTHRVAYVVFFGLFVTAESVPVGVLSGWRFGVPMLIGGVIVLAGGVVLGNRLTSPKDEDPHGRI